MAVGAFGYSRNYGWDDPFKKDIYLGQESTSLIPDHTSCKAIPYNVDSRFMTLRMRTTFEKTLGNEAENLEFHGRHCMAPQSFSLSTSFNAFNGRKFASCVCLKVLLKPSKIRCDPWLVTLWAIVRNSLLGPKAPSLKLQTVFKLAPRSGTGLLQLLRILPSFLPSFCVKNLSSIDRFN